MKRCLWLAAVSVAAQGCGAAGDPTAPGLPGADLPFVAETESVRVYASPEDVVDPARTEAHFSWMSAQLGVTVPGKIAYYKYLDRDELARRTGRTAPFVDAEGLAVHTVEPWERHETTRLVSTLLGSPPTFFVEGLVLAHRAQPFDENYGMVFDGQPIHRRSAIRLALGLLPSLRSVIDDRGFSAARVPEDVQLQAGSFVRRLLDTDGMANFRRFLRGSRPDDSSSAIERRFALVYRRSLGQAEADWHRFLARRALINAPVGLSDGPQVDSNGGAVMISFSSNGSILARNGGAYRSQRRIPYEFDVPYHFRLSVNMPARTYSAFVRAPGEPEQAIGIDYGFRINPNPVPVSRLDTLGLGVLPSSLGSLGALHVCNVVVDPTPSAMPALPCVDVVAGGWENRPLPSLVETFTVEFDATLREWAPPVASPPLGTISDEARAALNALVDFMQQGSINRAWIDWPGLRQRVLQRAAGARSVGDIHPAVSLAVDLLDDQHSLFVLADGRRAARLNTRQCEAPAAAAPTLPPDIGYVRVGAFTGTGAAAVAFADAVQEQIRAVDKASLAGWIVDLRGNTGGNLPPMIAGVGPVLGEGVAGHYMRADGSFQPWSYRDGAATLGSSVIVQSSVVYRLARSEPRVAVLTDGRTTSSGEAVTVSFLARPRTRSFGEATCGLSGNRGAVFRLADGASVELTTTTTADRNKRLYPRVVVPDETIYDTEALIRRAVTWLRSDE